MEISQACAETMNLLNEYGMLSKGWAFKLGRGKRRLGCCNHQKKTISISRLHILTNSDEEVRNTIRHEVAHALAGPGAGHGPVWKMWARKLGANPRSTTRLSTPTPYRYELCCHYCGMVVQRRHNRMSVSRLQNRWHTRCGPIAKGHLFMREIRKEANVYA